MNCPFCNKQIKHLAIHVKEEHPKKLNYLEKSKPKLYRKFQKEIQVYQMIKSKDPNLFTLKIGPKTQYFKYQCVRCGQCCHMWEIEIQGEDVERWISEGREKLLKNIQIYPKCISIMNLGLIQRLANLKVPEFSLEHVTYVRNIFDTKNINVDGVIEQILAKEKQEVKAGVPEKIKDILEIQGQIIGYYLTGEVKELSTTLIHEIDILREFILKNHDYLGEPVVDRWGNPIKDPMMDRLKVQFPQFFDEKVGIFKGKFPHWLLGKEYSSRAIFSPKTFQAIKKGWNLGLKYYLIYELHGGCEFLKNNICSIYDFKPIACKQFPYNRTNLNPEEDKLFLETCKGLKRIL